MQLNDTVPNLKTAQELGLNKEEFERIKEIMGGVPNMTELRIFAALWSEQCSHKHSLRWLKTLPREGRQILAGGDQDSAGIVDIGEGLVCALKMEAHNRQSSIDPYHGAAAALGGIHRSIFSVGARPLAALSSFCFGKIDAKRTKDLVRGAVKGMGDYGAALGLATIGGEVYFEQSYDQNLVVNFLSVGLAKSGATVSARATGPGAPVFIAGAATGKEGLFSAHAPQTESEAETPPLLPVGDPFLEKLLLEATLEAIPTRAFAGVQGIGAAGIARAAAEMCARSGAGMRIDLDKIPLRNAGAQPGEILLSENQERLLIVAKRGMENALMDIFGKWDLVCTQIGEVTDSGRVTFFLNGEQLAGIPAQALVAGGGAPLYDRPQQRPKYLNKIGHYKLTNIKIPNDYVQTAWKVFSSPNVVSNKWIYEQSDSMAGANLISVNRPADAALIRIKGSRRALALSMTCHPAYAYADPCLGAMIAVSEAARNIVCSGGDPLAMTHCLNFGDPGDPEVYWQFVQAVKGIGEAGRKLGTPVAGGVASFYNQSLDQGRAEPIYPTPTISMIGLLNDHDQYMTLYFKKEGLQIYMIGTPHNDLGSSEYLRVVHGTWHSPPPVFDLDEEFHIQRNLKKIIQMGLIESAHGISRGGLLVCLLECSMFKDLGFDVETDANFRKDAYLFGESQSRIVVTTPEESEDELVNYLNSNNVPFSKLGEVVGKNAVVDGKNFGAITKWKGLYDNFMGDKLDL